MPSIGAHMACAKLIGEKKNINLDEFYKGNILPDVMNGEKYKSHYKIKDRIYYIPNIEEAISILDLSRDLYLGYLSHLLLDKHFLSDYLTIKYPNNNLFIDGIIYKDYDILNSSIVNDFNLDVNYLEKLLLTLNGPSISKKSLDYNIDRLKHKGMGSLTYLDYEDFNNFLNEYSNIISEELDVYENKYRKLYIRSR